MLIQLIQRLSLRRYYEQPSLSIRGNSFLRELLSDDIGESVAEAIKIILEGGDNL